MVVGWSPSMLDDSCVAAIGNVGLREVEVLPTAKLDADWSFRSMSVVLLESGSLAIRLRLSRS